jgi:hypothetical protein
MAGPSSGGDEEAANSRTAGAGPREIITVRKRFNR